MSSKFKVTYPDINIAGTTNSLDAIHIEHKDAPGYVEIYLDPDSPLNNQRYVIGVFDDYMVSDGPTAELKVPFSVLNVDPFKEGQ